MATDIGAFGLGFVQFVLPLIAAYFSYVIYKHNRLATAWWAVTVALILLAFNRITAIINEFNFLPEFAGHVKLLDQVMFPLIISLLLIWGLWTMKKSFESFDVVERNISKKAAIFAKKKPVKRKRKK